MTPQLQQAIKLLQLSRLELLDTIHTELETNPVLEEHASEEGPGSKLDSGDEGQLSPPEAPGKEDGRGSMDWDAYLSEYSRGWAESPYEPKDTPSFESVTPSKTNLYSHLLWQLNLSEVSDAFKELGVHIIGDLDEDGYLTAPVEEIAQATGHSVDQVTEVLRVIQHFDPVGVAARSIQECLLIQANFLNLGGTTVEKILLGHMDKLENKRYDLIAKALSIPLTEIIAAIEVITSFEPKPGSKYSDEETIYISPDIYVFKVGDDYEIVQNEDGLPKLRISPYYRDILSSKDTMQNGTKQYIQDKLRSAAWLIKSIHQRQRTIYKVTSSIVRFQRDFLDKGVSALKPLVLRDVAEDIQMHESTVSRVTTNKYVHTPQGIFELKFFFNSSIHCLDGDSVSSESVKEHLKNLIKSENRARPYSDQEIAEMLKKHNIDVARRTVAKYRETLGILPSRKRKKPY